ncbi:hypothetical protein [uncultured Flavonifractor sp.]|uniref:hypothetical protein n=1 Tax=uncultured Flavonifractor sp. TaxID=1193534 RepID=UPI00262FE793|nr:hypothetical protein [uncultured Flavonifractor sp.]
MKKFLTLLLAFTMVCTLVACGEQNDNLLKNNMQDGQQQDQTPPPSNTPASDQSSMGETDITETIDCNASVSWANWSDDPKIRELALNKDTFELSSARHIPVYKCGTLEELNEFKTTFSGIFTMVGTWDEVLSFEEVTADYTEDFFLENTLLLVYVEAGSCTPRFGVDSVSKENGTLSVYVKYTYNPEEGDCAMAGWLFTIPVNNDQIQDCTNFDAVLK